MLEKGSILYEPTTRTIGRVTSVKGEQHGRMTRLVYDFGQNMSVLAETVREAEPEDFRNVKISFDTPVQSLKFQELVLGKYEASWYGSNKYNKRSYDNMKNIFIDEKGMLSYSAEKEAEHFSTKDFREIKYYDLFPEDNEYHVKGRACGGHETFMATHVAHGNYTRFLRPVFDEVVDFDAKKICEQIQKIADRYGDEDTSNRWKTEYKANFIGGNKMDMDKFSTKNIKDAKKLALEEKANFEVQYAKKQYVKLTDLKEEQEAIIRTAQERIKELNADLKVFN